MRIEEIKEGELEGRCEELVEGGCNGESFEYGAKSALIGAGARVLFYPTLLYNVLRNKMQTEFRWWDVIDEHLLLGAVPFPTDVPRLRECGVRGVVTLNEPYETLVSTSLYSEYDIENLVIPTRDYLFAPSFGDICKAVDFIHGNATSGKGTYVHCKAGRGRSTTIVLCYLVQHKQMTPTSALEYVRRRRPRIRLASAQWQAVKDFYGVRVLKLGLSCCLDDSAPKPEALQVVEAQNLLSLDDVVLVTEDDLDGYEELSKCDAVRSSEVWAELRLVYKVQLAGQAALAGLSYLWIRRSQASKEMLKPVKVLARENSCSVLAWENSCSVDAEQFENLDFDIHVY